MRFVLHVAAVAMLTGLSPAPSPAQDTTVVYPVKFVCGAKAPKTWDAVFPGRYFTAINIHNASSDSISIRTQIASTQAAPIQGTVFNGPSINLGRTRALEIDCEEILKSAHTDGFLKGFLIIPTRRPLDVVAVYTTGTEAGPSSIDVVTVAPRRASKVEIP